MSKNLGIPELNEEYNEITEAEELSLDDKMKAINLQDLIYIKKYIDDNHYDVEETDALIAEGITKAVDEKVAEKCYAKEETYTKTEIDNNHYTKTEIDNNHYTKAVTDETFYKRTDIVDEADNATKINGLELVKDENDILKIDDTIISRKKVMWSSVEGISNDSDSLSNMVTISGLEFALGDIIEVTYAVSGAGYVGEQNEIVRFQITDDIVLNPSQYLLFARGLNVFVFIIQPSISAGEFKFSGAEKITGSTEIEAGVVLYKISKIVE